MPRFSVAFSKRKSAADALENAPMTSADTPSFRVMERNDVANGRSFDGGARMARASKSLPPKTNLLELDAEDNIFADLKTNRGSNISNTTNATSTDTSSRHSSASTAPSSADMAAGHVQDENRPPKSSPQEQPNRTGSKTSGSGLLDRAARTFSFGGQKKHSIPPPREDPIPDMPPVLSLGGDTPTGINRGQTPASASTITPDSSRQTNGGGGGNLDLGGDFGSMFNSFDKRGSTATLTGHDFAGPRLLTGGRYGASTDASAPTEPLLSYGEESATSPTSMYSNDNAPPVPRHQQLGSFKYSSRPADIVEDEDAKLLRDSFTAMKFLSTDPNESSPSNRYGYGGESYSAQPSRTISSSFAREENMFEGTSTRFSRANHRYVSRVTNPPRNKVMTPAQFEKYRQDKERQGTNEQVNKPAAKDEDEDEDEINYDDDEDEREKSKQQAKQRRKQEAHMAVYRQQMMKVTGEPASTVPLRQTRPGLVSSTSAPALSHLKAPSPDPAAVAAVSDEDEDEDVPLAILQAHGFPSKNRAPTRLSHNGSNPNLRASAAGQAGSGRPASIVGDTASNAGRRHSTLPAFARNLPQDPFVGASIARPAVRESLSFGDAGAQQPQSQGPLPPGGLVGVIASEERSRAMRRGSPNMDPNKMVGGAMNPNGNQGYDQMGGIPPHMMYGGGGMPVMPPHMGPMPPQMLTPGDQAQIQMTQQMQQFMQMQMQFMQMMATNQNPGVPQMQPPYAQGIPGSQSAMDLPSSRHSMMGDPMMEPPRMDPSMRTMSMIQPSSASFMAPPGRPGSFRGAGVPYTPSIAPSERSNVGLPGRYRPVSQAASASPVPGQHSRSNTMSGGLSGFSDDKSRATVRMISTSRDGSDDDEEQAWEAMKAKRDKKRSMWRSKKSHGSELDVSF